MSPRYVNPAAHDAYLHGRYLWYASQYDKASEFFKKATELQPDYAPGWSGLSIAYGGNADEGRVRPGDSFPLEEDAANKAVQLDDTLPEAHLAQCGTIYFNHWDWVRADRECLRAIELDPTFAEAYHLRAKILASINRHQEAIEVQKKATELDSFARPWALAYSYQLDRQYDAALTDARQRLESTPNDPGLHWILEEIYRCKGMDKEAVEELEKMLSLAGYSDAAEAVRGWYQKGGYRAVMRGEIASREKQPKGNYVAPVALAEFYAQLGNREKTIALLEQGFRERSPLLLTVQDDPAFDFVHGDERYRAVIKGMGLPPAY
jgi:tetratricopeptide (TPR) repeat protein